MKKLALLVAVVLVATLALSGGATARGRGSQEWSIAFVSATTGSPYGTAIFSITRIKPPIRFNLVYRAQMWTRCVQADGFAWDIAGETKWIYSDAASTPIRAQYFPGMACRSWARNTGGDFNQPDSNVISYVGP